MDQQDFHQWLMEQKRQGRTPHLSDYLSQKQPPAQQSPAQVVRQLPRPPQMTPTQAAELASLQRQATIGELQRQVAELRAEQQQRAADQREEARQELAAVEQAIHDWCIKMRIPTREQATLPAAIADDPDMAHLHRWIERQNEAERRRRP